MCLTNAPGVGIGEVDLSRIVALGIAVRPQEDTSEVKTNITNKHGFRNGRILPNKPKVDGHERIPVIIRCLSSLGDTILLQELGADNMCPFAISDSD